MGDEDYKLSYLQADGHIHFAAFNIGSAVTLNADGSVTFGPGFTADDAAKAFWECLANANPLNAEISALRSRLEEVERERDAAVETGKLFAIRNRYRVKAATARSWARAWKKMSKTYRSSGLSLAKAGEAVLDANDELITELNAAQAKCARLEDACQKALTAMTTLRDVFKVRHLASDQAIEAARRALSEGESK